LILVDANLLLYAYHAGAVQHPAAKRWLESALAGADPVGLSWSTILAFLRIGTNPRVFERPYSIEDATEVVSSWLAHPAVAVVRPGEQYWEILRELLLEARAGATLVTDAALGGPRDRTRRDALLDRPRFPPLSQAQAAKSVAVTWAPPMAHPFAFSRG